MNPLQNSKRIDSYVQKGERLLVFLVAAAGSVLAFQYIRLIVSGYTDIVWIQIICACAAACAVAFITDFAFRNFLTEALFWPFALFHPQVWSQIMDGHRYFSVIKFLKWSAICAIVAGLFWIDWGTMQNARNPIAASQRKIETTDISSMTGEMTEEMNGLLAPIKARISEVEKTISKKEGRVEAENPKLITLIKSGNGWARKELAKQKARATKKDAQELASLNEKYNEVLSGTSSVITSSVQMKTEENAKIQAANMDNQVSLSNTIFLYGGFVKILTIIFRVFLVLSYLANARDLDVNGDGVINGQDVTSFAKKGDPGMEPGFI